MRYTLGLTALLVAATAAFKGLGLAHGSWLPFSMLVVLQPGAALTRSRMAHRVTGTVAGALVAGLPLWSALPLPALLAVIAVACAIFTYLMRRHYGTAVFFITLTVVLMTGLGVAPAWALALERLGCVVAGSLAAWGVARLLWPAPSEDQLGALLDAALDANRAYLGVVRNALAAGGRQWHEASVAPKRQAERVNRRLAPVLARYRRNAAAGDERVALAAFSQQLTSMVTTLFLQQEIDPEPIDDPAAHALCLEALAALDVLAGCEKARWRPDGGEPATSSCGNPDVMLQLRAIRDAAGQAAARGCA